jgi:hypothetical protein
VIGADIRVGIDADLGRHHGGDGHAAEQGAQQIKAADPRQADQWARFCTQLAMVLARPGLASQSGSSRHGTDV